MRAPDWLVRALYGLQAVNLQSATLDLPTLSLVAVCIAGLLGVFLIIDWMQQRNVRALAWWGFGLSDRRLGDGAWEPCRHHSSSCRQSCPVR